MPLLRFLHRILACLGGAKLPIVEELSSGRTMLKLHSCMLFRVVSIAYDLELSSGRTMPAASGAVIGELLMSFV